jgi:predicted nucleic acid-binding protein
VIVVDSSTVLDYVLELEPQATWAAGLMADDPSLHAPHAIDVEVLATLRRAVNHKDISAGRALLALDDFRALAIRRYPQKPFLERAWELRSSLSAPDALFAALAEVLGVPLVTTHQRLARAPNVRAEIIGFTE